MKDFYEKYWHARKDSGMRPRYDIFLEWIEPRSRVLEVGCGDGFFGKLLKESKDLSGDMYMGIDISEHAIQKAKQKGLDVSVMDAEKDLTRFSDKSFDYVIISEVIEHVANSEDVLVQAKRVARRGVIVSIPNIAYWKFRLQLLGGSFPKQWAVEPKEHLRYWSVSDFIKMAESLGFRVEKVKSSNGRKPLKDMWPNLFGLQVCFYLT